MRTFPFPHALGRVPHLSSRNLLSFPSRSWVLLERVGLVFAWRNLNERYLFVFNPPFFNIATKSSDHSQTIINDKGAGAMLLFS